MGGLNWIAVIACAASSLVLGALWYSPMLFGRAWERLAGVGDRPQGAADLGVTLGITFLLSLVAAAVFALFLGNSMSVGPATAAGASAGLCWVGAAFGINYKFERRPLGLWLINAGYHTIQFTLFGLILSTIK